MLLALPDQVDVAERPFVHKLLGAGVLGREAQLLPVHELDSGALAGGEHLVRLGERAGERLLAHHVLPRLGSCDDDVAMEVVRSAYADEVDVVVVQKGAVVRVPPGDGMPLGEAAGVVVRRGSDGQNRRVGHVSEGLGVEVRDEAGAHQAHSDLPHGCVRPNISRWKSTNPWG